MATGFISITKNTTQVTGDNTQFSSETSAGGFIVFTAGGTDYTLGVESVISDTALTLNTLYPGPSVTDVGFDFIPQKAMAQITAGIVAQSTEALRGLNLDKHNWQQVFSAPGNITVELPDGSTYQGPSWYSLSQLLTTADTVTVPNIREHWRRALIDIGLSLVEGSFEEGGTLTKNSDVLWSKKLAQCYTWNGGFPKTVPPSSTVTTSGGESSNAWESVKNKSLSAALLSDTGYLLVPSTQIQQWQKEGDIQGWGAKYDGVTPADEAIKKAITATQGSIVISGPAFISKTAYIKGFDNPTVTFKANGSLTIGDNFTFLPGTRGILCFHLCKNPSVNDPVITGARLYSPLAPEPWQDGDAGVEYLQCTGWCSTLRGRLKNFMTWGVIHTQVDAYCVDGTHISDCMVQSGVGGIDVKTAVLRNLTVHRIGLYGLEVESRNQIETLHAQNNLITQSQKGLMCYDSVLRPSINGITVKNCVEGVSFTNNAPNNGEGGSVEGCNIIDCRTGFLFNNVNKTRALSNTVRRFNNEVYTRTRAQDFIRKVDGNTAYMVNEVSARANLSVGDRIMLEDGVERTVASVTGNIVDPVFSDTVGFTTTPALDGSALHQAIFRPIAPGYAGVVMYGGVANNVQSNAFGYLDKALLSFGAHTQLLWNSNTYENVGTVLSNGQDGAVTNSKISVNATQCTGVTAISDHAKFAPGFCEADILWISNAAFNKTHTVAYKAGVISKIVCILDPTVTAAGTIVLRVNGLDVIGNFSGSPRVGVATLNLPVSGSLSFNLTDTQGNLTGDGFSVKLVGAFTEV